MAEMNREARIHRVGRGLLQVDPLHSNRYQTASLEHQMVQYAVPGVSVTVIDGRLVWARGCGVREAGGLDSVTPQTLFQACSISKPVAAIGALRLVQQGLLDLDEDVNQYLRHWRVPNNADGQPRITLRHLLSHTAGTTVHGFPGYGRDQPLPSLQQVLDGEAPANTEPVRVDLVPGAQFRYSGGGTSIVQQVMTDVTGQPFPALMAELVLRPLGMGSSTYAQPLPEQLWSQAASGHGADGAVVTGGWHNYPEMAAAGLWTTASDLARLVMAIQQLRSGEGDGFLRRDLVDQMLTSQCDSTYGIGFNLEAQGAALRFHHGGSNAGFKCYLLAYAERGQGAVVMTNGDEGLVLVKELLRAIAAEYGWPKDPAYTWLGNDLPEA
jgi:CubicO group peptidase (beta-lactamase class C family)